MDLFDYAQELFNEQGDLWVPGLGYFSKVRKSSYYDPQTQMLYPPRYEGRFEEHLDNTDTSFIAYFSKSKNLSQGSSKYFVDKFVENIKERLQQGDVVFGTLGTLSGSADGRINFHSSELSPAEGALYGLSPVSISKIAQVDEPAAETATLPVLTTEEEQPEESPEVTTGNDSENLMSEAPSPDEEAPAETPAPAKRFDPHNFYTDDRVLVLKGRPQQAEQSNRYQFWILAMLVGLVILAGIYFVTQNYLAPLNEDGSKGDVSNQILSHNVHADTAVNTARQRADSALAHSLSSAPATLPTTVDTSGTESALGSSPDPGGTKPAAESSGIPKGSWLVVGGKNNNYDAAVKMVSKYRQMGYAEARLLDSARKDMPYTYKVIFGSYNTVAQANSARAILLEEKKLKPKTITVQKYK